MTGPAEARTPEPLRPPVPLEPAVRPRVVFLGGLGRSGTTLVERTLDESRDVAALGEVVHLWERSLREDEPCGCGRPFSGCPFWQAVGDLAFGGWSRVDAQRVLALRDRVDRSWHVPKLLTGLSSASWRGDLEEYLSFYDRLYVAAAQVAGVQTLVDSSKQASLPHCLRRSHRVDLRVVHWVRDSRAVAFSWGRTVTRPEDNPSRPVMERYSPAVASFYWLLHNGVVELLRLRRVPMLRVRYEDFLREPRASVRSLRTFAGLDGGVDLERVGDHAVRLTPSHTCSGNPVRFAQGEVPLCLDDRWRSAMVRSDARLVSVLTAPLLVRYGYARPARPARPARSVRRLARRPRRARRARRARRER